MRVARGFAKITLPFLAACSDPIRAPAEYDLQLRAGDLWSGGQVVIGIPEPPPPDGPTFSVLLDGEPLETTQPDANTIVARLPDLPGAHRLSATIEGGSVTISPDIVRLYGFRERLTRAPLKGNLHNWPGGSPRVLGLGAQGPALLDLASGATVQWADTIGGPGCNLGGVGLSWRPDHFVLQGHVPGGAMWTCTPYGAWQLLPSPARAADPFPAPVTNWQPWAIAEVAPGRWVTTSDDDVLAWDCRSGACVVTFGLGRGGAEFVALSPRGDRLLIPGPLVRMADPETLTTLYFLADYDWLYDALFYPGGDSLLVVGRLLVDGNVREPVRILDPSDGRLLAEIQPVGPDGTAISPTGLALDPAGWIYVAGEIAVDSLRVPALLVVEGTSLEAVALLRVGLDQAFSYSTYPYDGLAVVPAPLEGRIYVVWESRQYDPPSRSTGVYVFDRVP